MRRFIAQTIASGFGFLEGPRWRDGKLFVSDMAQRCVLTVDPDGTATVFADVPGGPSGLGFLPDGTLLVASMGDRTLYAVRDGTLVRHAELGEVLAGPINDMVVDDQGRAYVGSFGFDLFGGAAFAPSALALVATDGTVRRVADGLAFPNGMAIDRDRATLVVAESMAQKLTRFDIAADGTLGLGALHADLGDDDPDGICLDADGCVWAAIFRDNAVLRVDRSGRVTGRVEVRARRAVACALGGRTLYCVTSASSWRDICAGRGTGQIETAEVDVPGAGSP